MEPLEIDGRVLGLVLAGMAGGFQLAAQGPAAAAPQAPAPAAPADTAAMRATMSSGGRSSRPGASGGRTTTRAPRT